jgi:hypothetical protein
MGSLVRSVLAIFLYQTRANAAMHLDTDNFITSLRLS